MPAPPCPPPPPPAEPPPPPPLGPPPPPETSQLQLQRRLDYSLPPQQYGYSYTVPSAYPAPASHLPQPAQAFTPTWASSWPAAGPSSSYGSAQAYGTSRESGWAAEQGENSSGYGSSAYPAAERSSTAYFEPSYPPVAPTASYDTPPHLSGSASSFRPHPAYPRAPNPYAPSAWAWPSASSSRKNGAWRARDASAPYSKERERPGGGAGAGGGVQRQGKAGVCADTVGGALGGENKGNAVWIARGSGKGTRRRYNKSEKAELKRTRESRARAAVEARVAEETAAGEGGEAMVGVLWNDDKVSWLTRAKMKQALESGTLSLSRLHFERRIEVVPAEGSSTRATARVYLQEDQQRPRMLTRHEKVVPYANTTMTEIIDTIFRAAAGHVVPYGEAGGWPQLFRLGQWSVFLSGGTALNEDGKAVRAKRRAGAGASASSPDVPTVTQPCLRLLPPAVESLNLPYHLLSGVLRPESHGKRKTQALTDAVLPPGPFPTTTVVRKMAFKANDGEEEEGQAIGLNDALLATSPRSARPSASPHRPQFPSSVSPEAERTSSSAPSEVHKSPSPSPSAALSSPSPSAALSSTSSAPHAVSLSPVANERVDAVHSPALDSPVLDAPAADAPALLEGADEYTPLSARSVLNEREPSFNAMCETYSDEEMDLGEGEGEEVLPQALARVTDEVEGAGEEGEDGWEAEGVEEEEGEGLLLAYQLGTVAPGEEDSILSLLTQKLGPGGASTLGLLEPGVVEGKRAAVAQAYAKCRAWFMKVGREPPPPTPSPPPAPPRSFRDTIARSWLPQRDTTRHTPPPSSPPQQSEADQRAVAAASPKPQPSPPPRPSYSFQPRIRHYIPDDPTRRVKPAGRRDPALRPLPPAGPAPAGVGTPAGATPAFFEHHEAQAARTPSPPPRPRKAYTREYEDAQARAHRVEADKGRARDLAVLRRGYVSALGRAASAHERRREMGERRRQVEQAGSSSARAAAGGGTALPDAESASAAAGASGGGAAGTTLSAEEEAAQWVEKLGAGTELVFDLLLAPLFVAHVGILTRLHTRCAFTPAAASWLDKVDEAKRGIDYGEEYLERYGEVYAHFGRAQTRERMTMAGGWRVWVVRDSEGMERLSTPVWPEGFVWREVRKVVSREGDM